MPFCPICDIESKGFQVASGRADARCPVCGSLERHRLDWLFLQRRTDLFDGRRRRLLHFAPENCLREGFRGVAGLSYVTADLNLKDVDVRLDLTALPFAGAFDAVYCSHVLEHIEDDRTAIGEMHRAMRPGGWALLQVPIKTERTWESPEASSPRQRRRLFGQHNHVRLCGPDYADRYREAGFVVEVARSTDVAEIEECRRCRFQEDRYIFYCRKPADRPAAVSGSGAGCR